MDEGRVQVFAAGLSRLESDTQFIRAEMERMKAGVERLEVAILGDLEGFKGIRQKSDEAYETAMVVAQEHKELKARVSELSAVSAKRTGMLIGIASVVGGLMVKAWEAVSQWFTAAVPPR